MFYHVCRPLTGARIETVQPPSIGASHAVAPSRGRGSKPRHDERGNLFRGSPPHGGADRNLEPPQSAEAFRVAPSRGRGSKQAILAPRRIEPRRPLTGARIETFRGSSGRAPAQVAPSRGRGSKQQLHARRAVILASPPHGGADRNINCALGYPMTNGRPLTGARIETSVRPCSRSTRSVAPSRGRGSKPRQVGAPLRRQLSPPHGGADRNHYRLMLVCGALVAPSRGRGSKHATSHRHHVVTASPPHGGADRNACHGSRCGSDCVAPSRGRGSKLLHGSASSNQYIRPLTGARIETRPSRARPTTRSSPPHGGADRNGPGHATQREAWVAPSRGRGSKHRLAGDHRRRGRVAPSRRRGSKRPTSPGDAKKPAVAPSRGRGSKPAVRDFRRRVPRSPPHGGADRNSAS